MTSSLLSGSESDYVILSTVRSSSPPKSSIPADQGWLFKHIGFVTDDHQINVAITRAKLGLLIIGEPFIQMFEIFGLLKAQVYYKS